MQREIAMRLLKKLAVVTLGLLFSVMAMADTASMSIAQIASNNPDFSTLVAALKAAGLDKTLAEPGEYTVFAPTNEAFAKLPAGTVEDLLKPENKQKLTDILLYHVVQGKVMSGDIQPGKVKTLNSADLDVTVEDGNVMINDQAKVDKADIAASNGVIHVINTVLIPAHS